MAKTPKDAPASTTKPSRATIQVRARHPLYSAFAEDWNLLSDVREGTGGFKDGTHLIPHPREWKDHQVDTPTSPTKKLLERRALACYENFADTIIESKKASLFRESPKRRIGPGDKPGADISPLEQWWKNIDGAGTAVDDFFAHAWDIAATFGHMWLFMDRPKGPAGTTAADTQLPFLRFYTPLDLIDWLVDDKLQMIRALFLEVVPRTTFAEPNNSVTFRMREVTPEYWALYDSSGALMEGGPTDGAHRMGLLPVFPLFAQRRALKRHIGKSVLGDPRVYRDLYNLTSEIRELLRKQTFSFINVQLGTGPDAPTVDAATTMMGTQTGSSNVLFSPGPATMLSGDSANVTVYHAEINRRLRNIYRAAAVGWESDTRDAEAQGSLKLKREDMNTRLASYADEIEKTEYAVATAFFRAIYGAENGQRKFEEAQVAIKYPDEFDLTPFDEVLKQAQAAMSMNFPSEVIKEIRKSILAEFLPDLSPELQAKLIAAIDHAADDPSPMEKMKAKLQAIAGGGKGVVKAGDVPPDGGKAAAA